MLDQILTLIMCVGVPFLLIITAAIIGTYRRLKMANKIIVGIHEGRFKDFSTSRGATKIRWFSIFALVSSTGIFLIPVLVIAKIWTGNSVVIIALFLFFISASIFWGTLLYREVTNRLK